MKGKWVVHLGMVALAGFGLPAFAGDYGATTETVGHGPNGFETPVNQLVTPAGTLIELPGIRPNALALSPDDQRLVTAGLTHTLVVVDPATGKILQRVPLPADDKIPTFEPAAGAVLQPDETSKLGFTGLAFSPDGSRIYLANVNGDLKVFSVGQDYEITPLFSLPLPPANAPGRKAEIPAGIAVSLDGKKLYVALNLSNRLAELDAATGQVLRIWDVGVAPFDVALAGHKVYVSNWGGRRPDADSVTGPAGDGMRVRVDARSIASEGSVSVIDLSPGSAGILPASASTEHAAGTAALPAKEIRTGLHACALALSPDGRWLVFVQCKNGQLMRPDSQLYIIPSQGGVARKLRANTRLMNSWHSFSPNGRWLVFSSKARSPYTQMYLTHIDENGNDSPAILIDNATAENRAVNIPEFVNIPGDGIEDIQVHVADEPALADARK